MLPAYPWSTRPSDQPLTADEVCAALAESDGDVTCAAQRLKVGSLVLRKFIERSPRARAVILEMDHRLVDAASSALRQALRDEDHRRQDWAIRFILNSEMARYRQLSSTSDASAAARQSVVNVNVQPVKWLDGTEFGPKALPAPPTIDVAPEPPRQPPQSAD